MKKMKVTLNDFEQAVCRELANHRFSNNRKGKVRNSKIGPQSNAETDLEGVASEFAFCKIFNLYPDFTISVRSAKDDKGDTKLSNGQTVDVKSTKYATGKLLAVSWKKQTGDYFALMVGMFPTYEFKGFMKQSELLKESRLKDLGYGLTYAAEQSELKLSIEELENG